MSVVKTFEDEYVALDSPHIPEPTRSEMTKELELRSDSCGQKWPKATAPFTGRGSILAFEKEEA